MKGAEKGKTSTRQGLKKASKASLEVESISYNRLIVLLDKYPTFSLVRLVLQATEQSAPPGERKQEEEKKNKDSNQVLILPFSVCPPRRLSTHSLRGT